MGEYSSVTNIHIYVCGHLPATHLHLVLLQFRRHAGHQSCTTLAATATTATAGDDDDDDVGSTCGG